MTSNTKYNGWTNYATWRVNLEMFDGFPDENFTADEFKFMAIENIENGCDTGSLAFDYAMAFLDEVNWHEIADAHKED